jgi:radical SAM superfamily enzyme YgiQ (UPF0313 family)
MKIALAYAPSEQQFIPVPPLGIAVLNSYMRNKGISVDTFDLELELWMLRGGDISDYAKSDHSSFEISDDAHLSQIANLLRPYDVICFSLMGARQIPYTKYIVKQLNLENKTVIIGGVLLNTENAYEISKIVSAEYAIVGEGWNALHKVINNMLGRYDDSIHIDKIKDRYIVTNKGESDFYQMPMADYTDINIKGYIKQQKKLYKLDYDEINYQILVGDRCCPYNCSFCRISKNTSKIKTAHDIANEMYELNKSFDCKNFSLICNEMNPNKQFLLDFTNALIKQDKNFKWFCYLRPNDLSKENIESLKSAGCVLARYGVESGSQKILDSMNKHLKVTEIEQILKDTHEAGIWNHINIMTGYLYESDDDIDRTIDFIKRNHKMIDSVRINPFFIPINSPIHIEPEKFKIKLFEDTGSFLKFNQEDSDWEEKKKQIKKSTDIVLDECMKLGIGFAGILPNLVSTALAHFNDKHQAKAWLQNNHAYLWEPISPDTAKWRLAHPSFENVEINSWGKISGERGDNYRTRVL